MGIVTIDTAGTTTQIHLDILSRSGTGVAPLPIASHLR